MTRQIMHTTLLAAAAISVAGAQQPTGPGIPNRPNAQARAAQPLGGDSLQGRRQARPNRQELELRVRNRLAEVARRQLGLNDAQVEKLQKSNQRFAERRRVLMEQERDVRMSLRDELIGGDSTRQKQVGDLLDRMMKTQRQRVDLLEEEQKDLASFLTPTQRARYFGLEEDLRRRVQLMQGEGGPGMRGNRLGGRPGMRPGGPPPDGPMPMDGMGAGGRMGPPQDGMGPGGMGGAAMGPGGPNRGMRPACVQAQGGPPCPMAGVRRPGPGDPPPDGGPIKP